MPSILVRSGQAGTAGIVVVMTAETVTFEYQFPRDLRNALDAFKTFIGLDSLHASMLSVPTSENFAIVEYIGGEMATDSSERIVRFNIYVERAITNTDETQNPAVSSTIPVSYVVMRIKRLIEDNGNWDGKLDIDRLISIDDISGSVAPQLFNPEESDPHVQSALITITYAVRNAAFQPSDL